MKKILGEQHLNVVREARLNSVKHARVAASLAPAGNRLMVPAQGQVHRHGGLAHAALHLRSAPLTGQYVIDQKQCEQAQPRPDSIALGSYSVDSHICQRLVKDGAVIHESGFMGRHVNTPYAISYPAITPRPEECEHLLVTYCVSRTHLAFASVRMEPPFMILSESAAFAVDQALKDGVSVQAIIVEKLAAQLVAVGQVVSPKS